LARHGNIKTAFGYFSYEISNRIVTSRGQRRKTFESILKTVLDRLIFIRIKLNEKDDAQSIFETINYAGVPLSAADLARNFVLGLASGTSNQQELNKAYWQPLESRLEN